MQSKHNDTTVFIVDDDEAVRDSLHILLQSIGQKSEVFAAPSDFLKRYHNDLMGCLVLDIRMPAMSGLELQRRLRDLHCILPIIFITGHGDVPMAVRAIQDGAMEFIQKPFRDQDLLDLINKALILDKKQRDELMKHQNILQRISRLSEREHEILYHLIEGKSNKAIALDIGLSQRTIEIHRSHVMKKMQTRSVAHLVRQVMAVKKYLNEDSPIVEEKLKAHLVALP